jgi:hypothetical protein
MKRNNGDSVAIHGDRLRRQTGDSQGETSSALATAVTGARHVATTRVDSNGATDELVSTEAFTSVLCSSDGVAERSALGGTRFKSAVRLAGPGLVGQDPRAVVLVTSLLDPVGRQRDGSDGVGAKMGKNVVRDSFFVQDDSNRTYTAPKAPGDRRIRSVRWHHQSRA